MNTLNWCLQWSRIRTFRKTAAFQHNSVAALMAEPTCFIQEPFTINNSVCPSHAWSPTPHGIGQEFGICCSMQFRFLQVGGCSAQQYFVAFVQRSCDDSMAFCLPRTLPNKVSRAAADEEANSQFSSQNPKAKQYQLQNRKQKSFFQRIFLTIKSSQFIDT